MPHTEEVEHTQAFQQSKIDMRIRSSLIQKLVNLHKYVDSIKSALPEQKPSYTDIKIKIQYYASLLREFEEVQLRIEIQCDENSLPDQYQEREQFELRYCSAMSFLEEYMHNIQIQNTQQSNLSSHNTSFNQVDTIHQFLLPRMKMPTFSGDYEHWLEFKLSFASVMNSTSLSSNNKFVILRSSVDGYAKRLIDSAEINEQDPFGSAWKVLTARFDKKRLLVNKHVTGLFSLESIRKESAKQFRQFLDNISHNLTAIDNLKLTKENLCDTLLIYIISNKLDEQSLRDWKEHDVSEFPTVNQFLEFLKAKADLLEDIQDHRSTKMCQFNQSHKHSYLQSSSKNSYSHAHVHSNFTKPNHSNSIKYKCVLCQKDHSIYNCQDFLKLDIPSRISKVEQLRLCQNCLRKGHNTEKCYLGSCRKCQIKHNTLLHTDNHNTVNTAAVIESHNHKGNDNNHDLVNQVASFTNHTLKTQVTDIPVLLSTVTFKVKINGKLVPCRALLDSGSQTNLITQSFVNKFNIPVINTKLSIMGINQVVSHLTQKCHITIHSNTNDFQTLFACYVIDSVPQELPSQNIISNWEIPDNIQLSDPEFYKSREIDAILGAGVFWDLLINGKISLGKNKLTLQNTKLGWIISGIHSFPHISNSHSKVTSNSLCHFTTTIPEDEQLKRFWELEEVQGTSIQSSDDIECENLFKESTYRNDEDRFVVKLPLKSSSELLGDSFNTAKRCLLSLERKFTHNLELQSQYKAFMHEYISLGHMSKVSQLPSSPVYFLPHHGVLKSDSLTTQLRVVFNGSSPTDSGLSLNDLQFTGPKIQNDIFPILLRFRTHIYVVSADIMKMYRQILLHPDHQYLHLILWRDTPDQDIQVYKLNTVTYGTTAAPYLAIKCLQQLAKPDDEFPLVSNMILNDFYVDDLLSGHNDLDCLTHTCKILYERLSSAGFILRKWISNYDKVLSQLNVESDSLGILTLGQNECSKTLGIKWHSQTDNLKYSISDYVIPNTVTKRQVLSEIGQLYDPLGLLCPSITLAKILIQKLWSLKINWDEPLPTDIFNQWIEFRSQLNQFNSLNIPRNVVGKEFTIFDIHCFCDASQQAYACCFYIRSQNKLGQFKVTLLCAKGKVAPLKTISLPRLELCAALLGAQLYQQVKDSLKLNVPYYFWSDSQIVLSWLKLSPNTLETFVANRISKIQNLTNIQSWYYVATKHNPADIPSRGLLPHDLLNNDIWWLGPNFLYTSYQSEWSNLFAKSPTSNNLDELPDVKKQSQLFYIKENTTSITYFHLFTRYSNFHKLKRIFAYCCRFMDNIRFNTKRTGLLTVTEIETAFKRLIKIAQSDSFLHEINILKNDKCLKRSSRLFYLSAFIDNDGILRVGGRLKFTHLPHDVKHPIILSANHPLAILIFNHMHTFYLHPGPQLLLSLVRQRYWVVRGKSLAKKIVHNCITCFKHKPKSIEVPIGQLPDNRVLPALPFQNVGIDYAGPFRIKTKKGRGAKIFKGYVCVFVCFLTKAIHLELLTDMTTECFFSCFNRFIARRGIPSNVYSDNGTTFKGAFNELKLLRQFFQHNENNIAQFATNLNIQWHFIPPYAPNFGGLWEASVKSMKHHLLHTTNNISLTYEDFITLLAQIESILNSRPLFSLSDDPQDLEPLTPSHFLIGRPSAHLPDPNLLSIPSNRLTSYKHIQQLKQQFWTGFSRHYISQLHNSYKWAKVTTIPDIYPGSLVLIKDSGLPSYRWLLGRIQKVITGKDGASRVAEIFTSKGIIVRSVRHLHPLPLCDQTSRIQVEDS